MDLQGAMMRLLAAAAVLAMGCTEEGLVLCVDADERALFDAVQISVTLAEGNLSDGATCRPASVSQPASALPYCVAVAQGSTYRAGAILRADGYASEERIARREVAVAFVDAEQYEPPAVLLYGSCAENPCGPDEQCVERDCLPVPRPGVFDDVDPDAPECDPSPPP